MERHVRPAAVQAGGSQFEGFYAIQSDMLTVWHDDFGSRTARVIDGVVERQVHELLMEIFRECRDRRVVRTIGRP